MTGGGRAAVPLRDDQIRRYARHVLLPDVGGRGQARFLAATVEVELGSGSGAEAAALAYLAAAGVGRLVLAGDTSGPVGDEDIARCILFGVGDRGRPRGQAAAERIAALNPDVEVVIGGPLPPEALRLADELAEAAEVGLAVADALAAGGAAAARLLVRIARGIE